VARDRGFDALLTISNEIPPVAGQHPTKVDNRKLRKVALQAAQMPPSARRAPVSQGGSAISDRIKLARPLAGRSSLRRRHAR
jgi:hypothetical protein